MRWGRRKTTLVQDGLFQIGAQAYQILLRGPPLEQPNSDRPVVVFIPAQQRSSDRRLSTRSEEYDEWDSRYMLRSDQDDFGYDMWSRSSWFKPSCVPISIILVLIVLVVLLPLLDAAEKHTKGFGHNYTNYNQCQSHCVLSIVETMPMGMSYRTPTKSFASTVDIWSDLIMKANETIEIAEYYWTLRGEDTDQQEDGSNFPGVERGEKIFNALLTAGTTRGLTVKIVQSQPSKDQPCLDTEILVRKGAAQVRSLNMPRLVGAGILHTKLWMVDRKYAYVGSANTDWRSLSHVKELGLYISNCSCLLEDIAKIFDVYWDMALPDAHIPSKWPEELSTPFNSLTPMSMYINGSAADVYVSSAPPQLCPNGRESDVNAILNVIHEADHFVYVSVMDYVPLMIYGAKPEYWPIIDDALRSAAIDRRIEVRLLISYWNHTRSEERHFLKSLSALSESYSNVKILVKFFVVPSSAEQRKIPFGRVNHAKYMVTDRTAYIGTSNWSGDYFVNTAGVGVVVTDHLVRGQLEYIFLRDWNSQHAHPI